MAADEHCCASRPPLDAGCAGATFSASSRGTRLLSRDEGFRVQCANPAQVHGRKAVVNFRVYADDVVREPRQQRVGASCSSADTSGPSHLGAPRPPCVTFLCAQLPISAAVHNWRMRCSPGMMLTCVMLRPLATLILYPTQH